MLDDPDLATLLDMIAGSNPVQQHFINEMLTKALAERVVRKGDVVMDVGANRGFHAFPMAKAVGASGIVHAFEPNPAHWPDLSRHENVRLWPFAAGDRQSVETFYFPENHDGAASLHDPRDFLGADWKMNTLTVVQIRIDDLPEAVAKPVSFVKMDVERHEFEALTGMRRVLERDRPVVVLENATDEIVRLFAELSYRPEPLTAALWPGLDTRLPNTAFLPDEAELSAWMPSVETIAEMVHASRQPPIS